MRRVDAPAQFADLDLVFELDLGGLNVESGVEKVKEKMTPGVVVLPGGDGGVELLATAVGEYNPINQIPSDPLPPDWCWCRF